MQRACGQVLAGHRATGLAIYAGDGHFRKAARAVFEAGSPGHRHHAKIKGATRNIEIACAGWRSLACHKAAAAYGQGIPDVNSVRAGIGGREIACGYIPARGDARGNNIAPGPDVRAGAHAAGLNAATGCHLAAGIKGKIAGAAIADAPGDADIFPSFYFARGCSCGGI